MTAQNLVEVIHGVTSAYAFSVRYRDNAPFVVGVIANSRDEAAAILKTRLSYLEHGELTTFGCGFARLQPAKITRWERSKMVEEMGYYAFLQGVFFARYGNLQAIYGCRMEKTSTGWYATIYGHDHSIKPLHK